MAGAVVPTIPADVLFLSFEKRFQATNPEPGDQGMTADAFVAAGWTARHLSGR
jgi:hypothetical protein